MKNFFLAVVAVWMTVLSVNAQVKVSSPHPDLDIQIKRCAYASGTVVIDMLITNYGPEERMCFETGQITAYDDDGNLYEHSSKCEIAVGLISDRISSYNHGYDLTLPQDIPLKFRVQIPNVASVASKLVLIKIPIGSRGAMALKTDRPLMIRNLEWVK